MKKINLKLNTGYTIIETMIAVSLFITIVMAGMGALLNANLLHNKSKDMRSIMDNLSFIMEDMSRNLRTGYDYKCVTSLDQYTGTASGQNCFGIAFQPANDPSRWVYEIKSQGNLTFIEKSTQNGDNGTWVQLTPDEVKIESGSGFSVLGAEPFPGNTQQPFVTIRLVGNIDYKGVKTPFSLQTSVSQRLIDR